MGKTSLKDILDGYLDTLKEQPWKPGSAFDKHDLLVQIVLPTGAALLYGTAWPLAASTTPPPKRWLKQSGIDGGRRLPVACWKEVILRICRLARFRRFV